MQALISVCAVFINLYWFETGIGFLSAFFGAIVIVSIGTVPILVIIVTFVYIYLCEKELGIRTVESGRVSMNALISNSYFVYVKWISAPRVFRYDHKAFICFLWMISGPINPNILVFYMGYKQSFFFKNITTYNLISLVSIPSAIMATLALLLLLRERDWTIIKIIGLTCIATVVVIIVSPFILEVEHIVGQLIGTESKSNTPEMFGISIVMFIFGWFTGIIPIAGWNLAKYSLMFAIVFFLAGTKRHQKTQA